MTLSHVLPWFANSTSRIYNNRETEREIGKKRQKETKGAETRGRMEIKKEEWGRATDKEVERQRVREKRKQRQKGNCGKERETDREEKKKWETDTGREGKIENERESERQRQRVKGKWRQVVRS